MQDKDGNEEERVGIKYMKNFLTKKTGAIITLTVTTLLILIIIVRAAITGITYDEAYTYLCYAGPLSDMPSLRMIMNIYWTSVANNHWLNTFLIAFVDKVTGIKYNEFLIRLPSILSGCLYYVVLLSAYKRKRINEVQFSLMAFCYYASEFYSLARGYGMAMTFVTTALLSFREWEEEQCSQDKWLHFTIISLLLAAYANSVALVVCFALVVVILYRLIITKQIVTCIKRNIVPIIIYTIGALLIIKYHFKVSAEGMPLWASKSNSVIQIMAENMSMTYVAGSALIVMSYVVFFTLVISFLILCISKRINNCAIGVSFLVYYVCLVSMNLIFHRGGFYGRTLLPGYPLVALGAYEIIAGAISVISERLSIDKRQKKYMSNIITILLCVFTAASFLYKLDITRTRDWNDDYNVKIDFYNQRDFDAPSEHASVVFYQEKREWDMRHLYKVYSGVEQNSLYQE